MITIEKDGVFISKVKELFDDLISKGAEAICILKDQDDNFYIFGKSFKNENSHISGMIGAVARFNKMEPKSKMKIIRGTSMQEAPKSQKSDDYLNELKEFSDSKLTKLIEEMEDRQECAIFCQIHGRDEFGFFGWLADGSDLKLMVSSFIYAVTEQDLFPAVKPAHSLSIH